jgi:hypothetical protein
MFLQDGSWVFVEQSSIREKKLSTPNRKAFNEEKLQMVRASCKPSKSSPSEKPNKKDANANPSKKESTK